jgi:hypothetical protein
MSEAMAKRAASTSPVSTPIFLSPPSSHQHIRDRSSSMGQITSSSLALQPQLSLFSGPFPEQCMPVRDEHFPMVNEEYLEHQVTSSSGFLSIPGYPQSIPASYSGFPQTASCANPSPLVTYSSPINHDLYTMDCSPITTCSGSTITPITPTSQADWNPSNPLEERPSHGINLEVVYGRPPFTTAQDFMPNTPTYKDPDTPVDVPDFFRQIYPYS